MSELKTLKDIWKDGKWSIVKGNHRAVDMDELKQEAIKRYKHYFYMAVNFSKQDLNEDTQFCLGHCREIKEFNNLTEEDLK